MNLWETRDQSLELLSNEYSEEHRIVVSNFQIIDLCIDRLDKLSAQSEYHKVCGITLTKARNLALGVYGLILDGLGQEAGALLRPFIEYHELLTYFRTDPKRIDQVAQNRLPRAGRRAKLIEGDFKEFRTHLNEYASHSSFAEYSIKHVLEEPNRILKKNQSLCRKTLLKNMRDFWVQIWLMTSEAILALAVGKDDNFQDLGLSADMLKLDGLRVFDLGDKNLP